MDIKTIESGFHPTASGKSAESSGGMVATAAREATEAGVEMLRRGGNAVDAAVAAAFALGVCESQASGLGGQTMMLIHLDEDKIVAVDGSSRAPSLAHVSAVYKKDRTFGYRAATVPSTPAVLWYVQERYGRLKPAETLEPAIHLARNGCTITLLQHRLQVRELEQFNHLDSRSGSRYFLNNGHPYLPGDRFKQPDLADCLEKIAKKGITEFYKGSIARIIDADMRENGGLIRMDDLVLTPWPIIRKPLKRRFRDVTVHTMPLPAAGRTLLFSLLMMDHLPANTFNNLDADGRAVQLLAELLRKAFLERSDRPFNPNFYPQMVEKDMLHRKYAKRSVNEVLKRAGKHINVSIVSEDEQAGDTTHLSVMDKNGMAVSLTQSIERVYGSKAAAAGLGFLYNNYLADFEYTVPDHPFYLRPNAMPWATVAPTMVYRDNRLWLALGSPGSERIISSLSQVLLQMVDHNMPMDQAIDYPRLHCSLGGRISLEAERFQPGVIQWLENRGYRIDSKEPYAFYLGCVQAVMKLQNGGFQGAADPRRDGTAGGI